MRFSRRIRRSSEWQSRWMRFSRRPAKHRTPQNTWSGNEILTHRCAPCNNGIGINSNPPNPFIKGVPSPSLFLGGRRSGWESTYFYPQPLLQKKARGSFNLLISGAIFGNVLDKQNYCFLPYFRCWINIFKETKDICKEIKINCKKLEVSQWKNLKKQYVNCAIENRFSFLPF